MQSIKLQYAEQLSLLDRKDAGKSCSKAWNRPLAPGEPECPYELGVVRGVHAQFCQLILCPSKFVRCMCI